MSDNRRFLSPSLRLGGLVDILFLGACAGTWLGFMGGLHWVLDLFSHFRWQYLPITALGIGWCLGLRRSGGLLLFCGLSFLTNGWELYRMRGEPTVQPQEGNALRIVSLNVLAGNPNKKEVVDYLRSARADLIFLMEVDEAWEVALRPLLGSHPHQAVHLQAAQFGLALYSRVVIQDARVFFTSETATPSLKLRLVHEGRELIFIGTHPAPPLGAALAASRDGQLRGLAGYVREIKMPVVLVGDLNATPWSYGVKLLREGTQLSFRSPDGPSMPTWQAGTICALPIDHALCTPPLRISRRVISADVGSDHRAQELEVRWEKGSMSRDGLTR